MSLVENTTRTRAQNRQQSAPQSRQHSAPQTSRQSLAELEARMQSINREITQLELSRPSDEINRLKDILASPNELLRYSANDVKDLRNRLKRLETEKEPEYIRQITLVRTNKARLEPYLAAARAADIEENQRNINRAGKKTKKYITQKQKYTLHKKQKNRLPKKQKYTLRKKKAY